MAFQFKIQIKNITKPPVWRRILVPEDYTFLQLHEVIQNVFGWLNTHLFQFSKSGYGSEPVISMPDEKSIFETIDASEIELWKIFKTEKQKFTYIYDFGDDWIHSIILEKITPEKITQADCLAGKGTCPPENCGGPFNYEELKQIVRNPNHPDYIEMRELLDLEKEDDEWNEDEFNLQHAKDVINNDIEL